MVDTQPIDSTNLMPKRITWGSQSAGPSALSWTSRVSKTHSMASNRTSAQSKPATDTIPNVRVLDDDECWRLLAESSLGRFAVKVGDGVDVFPVNYLAHERALFFRSAPGSKLIDLTKEPNVAFEVDGEHARHVWSVVVRGAAHRLGSDQEIHDSGIAALQTWYPSDKYNYVRISPETITGRSFAKSLPA
jgi:uncharacterized protein